MLEAASQQLDLQEKLRSAEYARSVVLSGKYDPDATQINKVATGVGADVKRTFERMCDDHNAYTENHMNMVVRPQLKKEALSTNRTVVAPHVKYPYLAHQIDQSTVDVFGGVNLDLGTMTREQERALRQHDLLKDDERVLPRHELVALLKVKMLDYASALKDQYGPRPVDMGYPNPASYMVNPHENTAQRLQRQTGLPQYVENPGPYFTNPQQQFAQSQTPFAQPQQMTAPKQEKKGLLSKVGSGIAKAVSTLKFW